MIYRICVPYKFEKGNRNYLTYNYYLLLKGPIPSLKKIEIRPGTKE